MKKLIFPFLLLAAVLAALASPGSGDSDPPPPPKTSALWGESGELWNPATSRLKDFTSAGYMSGNVPIPDWPVGVDVTDPQFGAIPNDDLDDSQAFIAAVAACPPNHAVFVPNGKYIMLQRVVLNRDYIVVRGEDMFQTVLFYPKYTNEVYINEVGFDPANPSKRNTGVDPFFLIPGGTHRSIENLTFEFREQIKMGLSPGAGTMRFKDDVELTTTGQPQSFGLFCRDAILEELGMISRQFALDQLVQQVIFDTAAREGADDAPAFVTGEQ